LTVILEKVLETENFVIQCNSNRRRLLDDEITLDVMVYGDYNKDITKKDIETEAKNKGLNTEVESLKINGKEVKGESDDDSFFTKKRIIWISIGGVLFLILLGLILIKCKRRREEPMVESNEGIV
jgi:hypothetical protein